MPDGSNARNKVRTKKISRVKHGTYKNIGLIADATGSEKSLLLVSKIIMLLLLLYFSLPSGIGCGFLWVGCFVRKDAEERLREKMQGLPGACSAHQCHMQEMLISTQERQIHSG